MKNLVLFGAGPLFKEVTDLHKQMINDQNYLMANFEEKLVEEGQKILRKYGIDPIVGIENLTWAPNIKGKHTTDALKELVEALKKIDEAGGTYDDIVKILKQFGKKAAGK